MVWQETPYTVPLIAMAAVMAVSALYIWRRREVPWAKTGTVLALAGTVWLLGHALELAGADLPTKLLWSDVQYAGIVLIPTGWLIFALQHAGRERWLERRILISLAIFPLAALLLILTNQAHSLFWSHVQVAAVPPIEGGHLVLEKTPAIGYWIFLAHSLVSVLLACSLLAQTLARSHQLPGQRAVALTSAVLVSALGIVIELWDDSPLDFRPVAFTVANLLAVWNLTRVRRGDTISISYRAILESMSDSVIVLDAQNRIAALNAAAQHLLRCEVSEIIGQPIEQVWPGWPIEKRTHGAPKVVREVTLPRGDDTHTYNMRVSPVLDWLGRLVSRVVVLHDITELKQRTAELSTLLETTRVALSALELEERLSLIAEQIVEATGVDTCTLSRWDRKINAIVTWVAWQRQDPELADKPGTLYALDDFPAAWAVLETRQPLTGRISDPNIDPTVIAHMGKVESVSLLMLPMIVGARVVGLVELTQSQYERDFASAEIRLCQALANQAAVAIENAQLYEEAQRQAKELTALNKTGQAIASTLNLEAVLTLAMSEAMTMIGVEAASALLYDRTTDELEFATIVGPASQTLIGTRMPATTGIAGWTFRNDRSALVLDAQNDPRFYDKIDAISGLTTRSLLAVPLKYKDRVIGVIEAINKASGAFDEHDLELLSTLAGSAAISIENARLYRQVRLQAEELSAAVARLRELDRLKSEFIQNVSHELRTPLALIRGYAEVLDAGELGELRPEQQGSVSIIARRTRLMSKLVEDITLIQEVEVNPPPPEPVYLDILTRTALEGFQITAEQTGLTLHAEIAPGLPPVHGSSIYLRRMLDNLVDNALKFTPAGGKVTVRVRPEGEHVALEVSDTGIGIPADQLDRIFGRFYQVNGSVRRRYGGTGLGLALVKEIIEACDGNITVKSQVGEGTTFTVTLNVSKAQP